MPYVYRKKLYNETNNKYDNNFQPHNLQIHKKIMQTIFERIVFIQYEFHNFFISCFCAMRYILKDVCLV